jgi:hypothetical protein
VLKRRARLSFSEATTSSELSLEVKQPVNLPQRLASFARIFLR